MSDLKKYICIAKCPELDIDGSKHCIATENETKFGTPYNVDYCPCGNETIWKEIDHESKEM